VIEYSKNNFSSLLENEFSTILSGTFPRLFKNSPPRMVSREFRYLIPPVFDRSPSGGPMLSTKRHPMFDQYICHSFTSTLDRITKARQKIYAKTCIRLRFLFDHAVGRTMVNLHRLQQRRYSAVIESIKSRKQRIERTVEVLGSKFFMGVNEF
jgi:hypothetical protein